MAYNTTIPVQNLGFRAFSDEACQTRLVELKATSDNVTLSKRQESHRTDNRKFFYGNSLAINNFSSYIITRELQGHEQLDFSTYGPEVLHAGE